MSEQLTGYAHELRRAQFIDASVMLFALIEDTRIKRHIEGEWLKFTLATNRGQAYRMSIIAAGAFMAILDYLERGVPLAYDAAKAERLYQGWRAVWN